MVQCGKSWVVIVLLLKPQLSSRFWSEFGPCCGGIGVTGMSTTPLISSVISGGIFVMGLVVAGTLVDYREAERAPTDVAASLYALLRETEAMNPIWGKPDMAAARARMIAVVTSLRADIASGNTRECQAAIEELSQTLEELEVYRCSRKLHRPAAFGAGHAPQSGAAGIPHPARGVPALGQGHDHEHCGHHYADLAVHRYGRPAGVLGDRRLSGLLLSSTCCGCCMSSTSRSRPVTSAPRTMSVCSCSPNL